MAAEAAISSVVELLGNLLVEKVKFLRGVEGEVQLLKEELKRMQLFLGVANRKAIEDPVVSKWISDLREVGLDTEDMVEMFLINHSRKNCIGFAKCVGHLDTIGHEVESIRAVYNHPDVVAHGGFQWRAWVVVSAEFNPHETMKQLMMELPESDKLREEIKKLEESTKDDLYLLGKLQEMLYKELEGKRYLIVVDDVWEKEHWESLTTVFPNQQD